VTTDALTTTRPGDLTTCGPSSPVAAYLAALGSDTSRLTQLSKLTQAARLRHVPYRRRAR